MKGNTHPIAYHNENNRWDFLISADPQLVIPARRLSTAGELVKRETSALASHSAQGKQPPD